MPQYSGGPYRCRTWIRGYLPWFLIDRGVASKGLDCEEAGGSHEWYNIMAKKVVVTIAVLYVQGNSGIAILTNEKISLLHN